MMRREDGGTQDALSYWRPSERVTRLAAGPTGLKRVCSGGREARQGRQVSKLRSWLSRDGRGPSYRGSSWVGALCTLKGERI